MMLKRSFGIESKKKMIVKKINIQIVMEAIQEMAWHMDSATP